ncbi:MAG: hypothetical protein JNK81_11885 [Anaerolineales bacterium]|nr:hypothetical protein [Anaerolineales bacterium]
MQNRTKIIFLFSFLILIFVALSLFFNSNSLSENNSYLTPIPYETVVAYKEKYPIDSKFEAVIIAQRYYITGSRMEFTQGVPKVTLVEKMNLSDAIKILGHKDDRPGNTDVWLVAFEGQWQILPPMSNELLPLEIGCIYIVLDANNSGYGHLSARDCISLQ